MNARKVAILDLGTNTFNLLISEINKDSYSLLFSEKMPVMIGQGGINQGFITDEAMGRAVHALKKFKKEINKFQIGTIYAFATSAFRNAKNGAVLKRKIYLETGIEVNIISGNQEAEYIYQGVKQAMPIGDQTSLIIDIGGGSVEFIIGNHEQILWKRSFEIGAQRLLDLFHTIDPIPSENIIQLEEFFGNELEELESAMHKYLPKILIGSSGTFDSLSDIYRAKENISIDENATELPLTYEAFLAIHRELILKNREGRLRIPGLISMRVDMIVVSSCLINFILNRYLLRKIRVSSFSLKEGMIGFIQQEIFQSSPSYNLKISSF